jgi:hypothetical protein
MATGAVPPASIPSTINSLKTPPKKLKGNLREKHGFQ